jgi:hypothetical protein
MRESASLSKSTVERMAADRNYLDVLRLNRGLLADHWISFVPMLGSEP